MIEPRTIRPNLGGTSVRPVRVRPQLGPDLTSADGQIDWVAVDEVLRGNYADLNRAEMDEICRVLTQLREQHHGYGHSVRPTLFNNRSPYREQLHTVAHALQVTEQELLATVTRWREKMQTREIRRRQRQDLIADMVAGLYPLVRMEVDAMSADRQDALRELCVDVIGSETDTLVAGGKRGPRDRSSLAAVTRAVALLAQADGGVVFLERHYCVRPHGDCPGRAAGTAT
jgi:hypothetical protein